jgi:hypothetical protein
MSVVENLETPSGRAVLGELTVAHWTLRDDPAMAAAVVAPIVVLVVVVASVTRSPALTSLVLVALAAASWSALLPVRYVFDATGVERRILWWRRRIPWAAVARCETWPTGVRLFRTADPLPLEALRAVFIPFAGSRDEILEQLERRALRCQMSDKPAC